MALMLASLTLGAMLAAIAVIDLRTLRIPDALSLPLIAMGVIWGGWFEDANGAAHLLGACAGYASLAGFGALYFRLRGREGLGLGDAKLFAAAGAWLGWQALPLVLTLAAAGGLAFALATRRARDARMAFGPWLALGVWLGWLLEHGAG